MKWNMALIHPIGVKLLVPVQLGLSAIAIPSGVALLFSPSGSAIGAQTILPHLTEQLPFITDFTPIGLFLLVAYGLVPIALTHALWARKNLAWRLTLVLGLTEVAWIAAEVILFYDLGFFFFYPIIAGMGVVTVALCLLPSVRRFYRPFDEQVSGGFTPSLGGA
jgi:hypothetical protein